MLTRFCDTYSPWWVETIILPTHTYDSCTNNRLSIIYLAAIKSAPCNPIDALYLYTNMIYYFCTMPMVCTILRFGGWVELHSHHETLIPKRQYVDHIMLGFAVILPHILQSKIVFWYFHFPFMKNLFTCRVHKYLPLIYDQMNLTCTLYMEAVCVKKYFDSFYDSHTMNLIKLCNQIW